MSQPGWGYTGGQGVPVFIVLWFTLLSSALAGPYYLESVPAAGKERATAVVDQARALGLQARVVRRYRHGEGWEYLARVEGWEDPAEARRWASSLASAAHEPMTVFVTEGQWARPLPLTGPQPLPDDPVTPPSQTPEALIGALALADQRWGGGWRELAAQQAQTLTYRRTMPDGATVDQRWTREGGREEVQSLPAPGVPSTVVRDGDRTTLTTPAGEQPVPEPRATALIASLGPRAFLQPCLLVAETGGDNWSGPPLARTGPGGELVTLGEGTVTVTRPTGERWTCEDWRWASERLSIPWRVAHQRGERDREEFLVTSVLLGPSEPDSSDEQ